MMTKLLSYLTALLVLIGSRLYRAPVPTASCREYMRLELPRIGTDEWNAADAAFWDDVLRRIG